MRTTEKIIGNIYRVCMFAELPECANSANVENRGKLIKKMIDLNVRDLYEMNDEQLKSEFYTFVSNMAESTYSEIYDL